MYFLLVVNQLVKKLDHRLKEKSKKGHSFVAKPRVDGANSINPPPADAPRFALRSEQSSETQLDSSSSSSFTSHFTPPTPIHPPPPITNPSLAHIPVGRGRPPLTHASSMPQPPHTSTPNRLLPFDSYSWDFDDPNYSSPQSSPASQAPIC